MERGRSQQNSTRGNRGEDGVSYERTRSYARSYDPLAKTTVKDPEPRTASHTSASARMSARMQDAARPQKIRNARRRVPYERTRSYARSYEVAQI